MSAFHVNKDDLTSVANAIRTKGKTTGKLVYPDGFVQAIENIDLSPFPVVTYSSNSGGLTHTITPHDNGNWEITFTVKDTNPSSSKTSANAVITFQNIASQVDIWLVGGGGGGGSWASNSSSSARYNGGSGGAGGKTLTRSKVTLENGVNYSISIGKGGAPEVTGGNTSITVGSSTYTASGGGAAFQGTAGNGGSGGGGGGYSSGTNGGNGGSNGSGGDYGHTTITSPGNGQTSTTRPFGSSSFPLYAAGGGGGAGMNSSGKFSTPGSGGDGGGGNGAGAGYTTGVAGTAGNAAANTGSGGGGGSGQKGTGGNGASGAIIIRNAR